MVRPGDVVAFQDRIALRGAHYLAIVREVGDMPGHQAAVQPAVAYAGGCGSRTWLSLRVVSHVLPRAFVPCESLRAAFADARPDSDVTSTALGPEQFAELLERVRHAAATVIQRRFIHCTYTPPYGSMYQRLSSGWAR